VALIFGVPAKQQIANRLQSYIVANFESCTRAATSLGISRQRMFSYTSGKALPGADIIDLVLKRWDLDLLGGERRNGNVARKPSKDVQYSLFDKPMIFKSDELKVVIKRKGVGLVANIQLSANVKVG